MITSEDIETTNAITAVAPSIARVLKKVRNHSGTVTYTQVLQWIGQHGRALEKRIDELLLVQTGKASPAAQTTPAGAPKTTTPPPAAVTPAK